MRTKKCENDLIFEDKYCVWTDFFLKWIFISVSVSHSDDKIYTIDWKMESNDREKNTKFSWNKTKNNLNGESELQDVNAHNF